MVTRLAPQLVVTMALAACAAFASNAIGAQIIIAQAAPVQTGPAQVPPAETPQTQTTGTVKGVLMNRAGKGQARVGVLLKSRANTSRGTLRAVVTDPAGAYEFSNVATGEYVVEAVPVDGEAAPRSSVRIESGVQVTRNLVVPAGRWTDARSVRSLVLTTVLVSGYLLLLLLFRFYNIIGPARALLLAQVDSVATRLRLEVADEHDPQVTRLLQELENIRGTLGAVAWGSTLFWSRGEEIAAWARIHEIERQLVSFLAPVARVLERVQTAEAELRTKASPDPIVLADRIRDTLRALSTATASPATTDPTVVENIVLHLEQQLGEALAIIYDDRDTRFATLMEWQNKAMWMTNIALIVIAVLSVTFGHEELFLLGAAGGLMSRMARALLREDVPTDYGASWTTLFLSPLLGAIAAWFGILLIVSLRHFGVLGELFDSVVWPAENNALTLTLAFLLGFSERLFTSLVSAVEGQVQSRLQAAASGAGAGGAAPVPPASDGIAAVAASAATPGAPSASADLMVRLLDLTPGERAALVGEPESPARQRLVAATGAANVFVVDIAHLASLAPLDAVLLEKVPDPAGLTEAAAVIQRVLAPRGRLVVVGSTPAGLFDLDAQTQAEQGRVGPALVHAAVTEAGLLAQEPAERLESTDPVRWMSAFFKPSVVEGDE